MKQAHRLRLPYAATRIVGNNAPDPQKNLDRNRNVQVKLPQVVRSARGSPMPGPKWNRRGSLGSLAFPTWVSAVALAGGPCSECSGH